MLKKLLRIALPLSDKSYKPSKLALKLETSDKTDFGMRLRIIGSLILGAFIFYGGGISLISSGQVVLGLSLVIINSIGVSIIGILFRPIIAIDNKSAANVYLMGRIGEALLLGLGGIILVFATKGIGESWNDVLYPLGMITLGLGSLPFCYWLISTGRIHKVLAWLGLVGYIFLILGMILTLWGLESQGMYLLLPGALFEIVFAGLLLFLGGSAIRSKA